MTLDAAQLFDAVEKDDTAVLKSLIAQIQDINVADDAGRTALHHACSLNHSKCAEILLSAPNVNPDARDENTETPLHIACRLNHPECVSILLASTPPASIHLRETERRGRTSIHLAADSGACEIIEMLILAGADCNLEDFGGMSAVEIAEMKDECSGGTTHVAACFDRKAVMMKKEIDSTKSQLQSIELEKMALEKERSEIISKAKMTEQIEARCSALQRQLDEALEHLKESQSNGKILEMKLREKDQELESLGISISEERETASAKIVQLEAELIDSKTKYDKIFEEAQSLSLASQKQEVEIEQLVQEKESFNRDVTAMSEKQQQMASSYEGRISQIQEENTMLHQYKETISKVLTNAINELKDSMNQKEQLQSQVDLLTQQLQTRESAPAEARKSEAVDPAAQSGGNGFEIPKPSDMEVVFSRDEVRQISTAVEALTNLMGVSGSALSRLSVMLSDKQKETK